MARDEESGPATVAVALGFTSWEPQFVAVLGHPSAGVSVARRCFDTVDLLAYTATTQVDAVVADGALPALDAEVIADLHRCGVGVVVTTADIDAEPRLRAIGADEVVFISHEHLSASARAAATAVRRIRDSRRQPHTVDGSGSSSDQTPASGQVISVWGPPGSTGRSTVAISIADELARAGTSCALVDADLQAPAIDQLLGITAGGGSLAWALRHAAHGDLTRRTLLEHMPLTGAGVRLLLGASGGSSLRPSLWESVCRHLETAVETIVCDMGVLDVNGPRWLADPAEQALAQTVMRSEARVIVGTADPVGLARLTRHLQGAADAGLMAHGRCVVAITRLRPDDADAAAFVSSVLAPRALGLGAQVVALDDDARVCSVARSRARTIAEVAPKSRLRQELRQLATLVAA